MKTEPIERPKNWQQLLRHPLSAEYADLTGRTWDQFIDSLNRHGILGGRRITLYEGMVLDGWQLHRGCLDAGIEPEFQELAKGVNPVAWVEAMNDHRRHEDLATIMRRADERRERVRAARQQGSSLRAIAEREEVSESQVRRDLDASGAPPPAHLTPKARKSREKTANHTRPRSQS